MYTPIIFVTLCVSAVSALQTAYPRHRGLRETNAGPVPPAQSLYGSDRLLGVRSDKPKPVGSSGTAGQFDHLAASLANFGNAQGSSYDAIISGVQNGVGTLLSGITGSGSVNTAFVDANAPKPKDPKKKTRELAELVVRSLIGARDDINVLVQRSSNKPPSLPNVLQHPSAPHSGIAGAFDNLGAGIANFGNGQGAAFDSVISGGHNAIGTLISGIMGSGKTGGDKKTRRYREDVLVRAFEEGLLA